VPVQTGTKTYPNGTVDLEIHSAFTITTPFYVKDLQHCPWFWKHMEDDAGALVERFPNRGLEEKIKSVSNKSGGSTSEALGRLARVQASSPQGMGLVDRPWRWTVNDAWLRSSMYNYLLRQSDLEAEELRAKLKSEFPHGVHLTFVDNELVDYSPESLDEVWAEVKPETSEYLWADPVFDDYIQGQDIMNDAWNMFLQIMETSIPFVFYDPEVLDPAKIRTGFEVNEFVPIVPGTGAQAKEGLIPSRPSELKPELIQFMAQVRGILREIVGLMPVVFGAEAGGGQMTAEEARRRLNQALLVLSTTWNEMRMGWALAFRNAVRQLAKFSLGRLVSTNGHPDSVTVKEVDRIKDLLKGGWYFECDQAIPMGWTQLRDFVSSLFQENPALAELMGASDPDNLSQVNQGIGIPGWKIPGMVRKKYMSGIIERLLKEQAVPMPDGSLSPSIPFDPLQHPPEMVVPLIQNWIMEEGLEQEGNPGYLNVLAFGRAAQQFMQMQMQMQAPPPPKGSGSSSPPPAPTSEADKVPPQPEMQNAGSELPPVEPLPPEAAGGEGEMVM
jgi:hypothetical protein